MLGESAVWIVVFPASVFGTLCLTLTLVMCICGCRTKEHKDELVGLEGHVKITNPEEYRQEVNANNLSNISLTATDNSVVTEKPSTAKRSLPDLPLDTITQQEVGWEPNGDAGSELYATVGQHSQQVNKRNSHVRERSGSGSMSPSYAHVKGEHPYDKLKKVEHPYAQVKAEPGPSREARVSIEDEDLVIAMRPEVARRESSGDIQAATAIAGHVTASDDLPYMTPPTHFSGDSQDSGKGYTSISVREPLATIRAETKPAPPRMDPHYASVSDDSDDMYAAIDDPAQVYTSESETYAKIQPGRGPAEEQLNGAAAAVAAGATSVSAPQPPSVDSLKQMAGTSQSHSRQASSSSATSSTAVNSPKPEKRPANSPLPPPPLLNMESTEDLYSSVDKVRSGGLQQPPTNVEDMYAKVNKKVRKDLEPKFERGGSTESAISESSDSVSYKTQSNQTTDSSSRSTHSCVGKSTTETYSSSSCSTRRDGTDSFSSEGDPLADTHNCYERLDASFDTETIRSDPGYETVRKEAVSDSEPNYEQFHPQEHDYASISRTKRHKKAERTDSDGYAKIQPPHGYVNVETDVENSGHGYAKVMKYNNNGDDPNYEQVLFNERVTLRIEDSNLLQEPTYESLGVGGFESDDPNYESVRFVQTAAQVEPPYQLLADCESGSGTNI